jgi:hypothetical protein
VQIKNSVESLTNRLEQNEDKMSWLQDKVEELKYSSKDKKFKVQIKVQDI